MTVVPEHTFLGGITLGKIRGASVKKDAQQQKALALLQQPAQALSASKLKVDSLVRRGNPAEEILRVAESILAVAKEYKPDIIALGSRGLSGIESLLLGSVAERVARYADCSVLIGRASK